MKGLQHHFMVFDDEKKTVFIVKTNPINPLPNVLVRHTDGCHIMPNEYGSKLEENSIVFVDVHF